jgi:hypothetical protein
LFRRVLDLIQVWFLSVSLAQLLAQSPSEAHQIMERFGDHQTTYCSSLEDADLADGEIPQEGAARCQDKRWYLMQAQGVQAHVHEARPWHLLWASLLARPPSSHTP